MLYLLKAEIHGVSIAKVPTMIDITILHLSDLHIEASGDSYSPLLENLLDDIKEQTAEIDEQSLIVVVTGDIFHKGPAYNDSKNPQRAYNNALSFFKKLKEILGNKAIRLYFVPGNHDKLRNTLDEYLSSACRGNMNKPLDSKFFEKVWPYFLDNYGQEHGTGYLQLYQEVYSMFSSETVDIEKKPFLEKTFGVDTFRIKGKDYCVVMLNTAWNCFENDERNLVIGKFQFDQIKEEFRKKTSRKSLELTIVLGHHPTSSLQGSEEDGLIDQLISFDQIDANLYICGHRHDQLATNWMNNRHSLSTFISGIGWPKESTKEYVGIRTYAFYQIDSEANAIEVYMRATRNDGIFQVNFSVYTGNEKEHPNRSMAFPLHAEKTQQYITLSRVGPDDSKAHFLSSEMIKYIQKYQVAIAKTCFEVSQILDDVSSSFYLMVDKEEFGSEKKQSSNAEAWWTHYNYNNDNDPDSDDKQREIIRKVEPYFQKYKSEAYAAFYSYLTQICSVMGTVILDETKGEPENKGDIRFHFRYLSSNTPDVYKNLCISLEQDVDYRVSDIKYGQLIQAAYESKRSLIYSVNKSHAKSPSKRWKDFITVIPSFAGNTIEVRKKRQESKVLPAITFGVSINSEKYEYLLYSLDFFCIRDIINYLIDRFFDYFIFKLEGFCDWLDNDYSMGGKENGSSTK